MESMMVMEAEMARRSLSTMGSNYPCGGGGVWNESYLPFSSINRLLSDNYGLFSDNYGSYQAPLYSSLSLVPHHQPPLLPLPFPAYGKKTAVASVRSKKSIKKKKKTKKVPSNYIRQPKGVQVKKAEEEEETGEEFLFSPSPSSLPIPRMLLTARPKAEAVSDELRRLLRI